MPSNKLKVTIPFTGDEALSNIERILITQNYEKVFWRSIVPPHKVDYTFSRLSDEGVERWKERFHEVAKQYIEPQWLSHCRFEVTPYDETK
jgi:hypothetical protein